MKRLGYLASAAISVCWSLMGLAQSVPQLINYQGQLLDAGGTPLTNGDYVIQARLFAFESGGTPIWGPQVFNGQAGIGFGPKIPVVQGRFNLVLGPQDTSGQSLAPVFAANSTVYIELQVGTGSPIAPRQQILSSPFALSAANAANAANAVNAASSANAANAANASNAANAAKLNGFDWTTLFAGGDPANGNMGLGITPSGVKLDVNGQIRVHQGNTASAGIWYSQTNGGDKAFVGMMDDSSLGFMLPSGARPLTYNLDSGLMYIPGKLQIGSYVLYTNWMYVTRFFNPITGSHITLHVDEENTLFSGNVNALSFTTTSDARLKDQIQTIADPIEKLEALRGVSFVFKPAVTGSTDTPQRRVGVLAQDVEKVLPEAVQTGSDGFKAVEYNALTPVLIEAVKAQQREIETLKAEIAELKAKQR